MTITDKPLKVLIPMAGTGTRLGYLTEYLNKALVDISGKPAISRIIDNFPNNTEFVIVLGYKGELVKQFLHLCYPDRIFYFTEVSKYEGEGSGLGLTILAAEKYLQEPFVFCACDTITDEKITYPEKNTAYYAQREKKNQYRTLDIIGNKVTSVLEKDNAKETSMPYTGLCCIKDYDLFWKEMHEGKKQAVNLGESYVLKKFAQNGILYAQKINWFDTGNIEELEKTRNHFKGIDNPNILPKPDEAIWFVNDKVIKYSDNKNFIKERVLRTKYLKGYIPEITANTDNMYVYKKVEGTVLSKIKDISFFKKLLDYAQIFWEKEIPPENFREICKKFYYDKTIERINLYYKNFLQEDKETVINGVTIPKLKDILKRVNWENIFQGEAGRFHGDFHFENILYNENTDEFTFLDWRQNFGGLLNCGDIYYDLAKLLHGLIICHELISNEKYSVNIENNVVKYSFERKPILMECEEYYYNWLQNNGYDEKKVKILTALIYLNIAALHHYPYCHLLYYLGKTMLYENT